MTSEASHITTLIQQWQMGSREAADQLMQQVYPDLKKIGCAYMRNERSDHTLAPTALVNELYLRFIASPPVRVQNRSHFFALAAQTLRHILVDYARIHMAKKRGANCLKVTLSATKSSFEPRYEDLLSVDEALSELQKLDSRAAKVVELKFFGGLNEQEVAQVLGVSPNTVLRDWKTARAWLMRRLGRASALRQEDSPN
jgi:RNA polymerase sigma factor (TIGR02999 family)